MNHVFSRGLMAAAAFAALSLTSAGLFAEEVAEVEAAVDVVEAAEIAAPVIEKRQLNVIAELHEGTKLTGTLTDLKELVLRTSFGETNIPLSEVAGIRFAPADSESTTVVMLNGDSITGATEVELMTVATQWGIAEIKGDNIASVMFVTGLAWESQVGLTGDRWNLKNVVKPAAPKANTAKTNTASNRRSSSNYRRSTSLFGR